MQRYGYLIGVEKYNNFRTTEFCHDDVDLLYNTLTNNCDYNPLNIEVKKLAPESDVSRTSLLEGLDKLAATTKVGDTLLFYFAGHGYLAPEDEEPYLLLPGSDLTRIQETALPLRLVASKFRDNGRINIRILDACHSGSDVRGEAIDSRGFMEKILSETISGWITLAACNASEFSYPEPEFSNGVFTHYLCEAINEHDEGAILPEMLKVQLCDKIADYVKQHPSKPQTPTYNTSISGNHSFATRKACKPPEGSDNKPAESVASIDLDDRLTLIRGYELIDTQDQHQFLETTMEFLSESVTSAIASIPEHGCKCSLRGTMDASEIPEDIRDHIVEKVNSEGFHPLHSIQKVPVDQSSNSLILSIFPWRTIKTFYRVNISQEGIYPQSYLEYGQDSDGYVPTGVGYFYILPLQVSIVLINGVIIHPHSNLLKSAKPKVTLHATHLTLSKEKNEQIITTITKESINEYTQLYDKYLERSIKYLEWEIEKSGIGSQ